MKPAFKYWIKVRACNGATADDCSVWSAEQSATVPPGPEPIGPPGRVQSVSFSHQTATSFRVTWEAPANNGGTDITGYGLQRKRGDRTTPWPPTSQVVVVGVMPRAWTFEGLDEGTHWVRIQACNGKNSCYPWTKTKGHSVTLVGDQVQDLRATAGVGQLEVSWRVPADTGGKTITRYLVQYRIQGDTAWTTWPHTVTSSPVTIDNLRNEATYDVQVRACYNATNDECGTAAQTTGRPSATTVPGPEPMVTVAPGPVTLEPTSTGDQEQCPRDLGTTVAGDAQQVDVIPRHGRRVTLCWAPVLQALRYVVAATDNVSNVHTTPDNQWHPIWRTDGTTSQRHKFGGAPQRATIDLDKILSKPGSNPVGLAQNSAYGIRVKAVLNPHQSYPSTPIIIIDTPITKGSGADGNVEITWNSVGSVLGSTSFATSNHKLRYRWSEATDHGASGWTPSDFEASLATFPTTGTLSNPDDIDGATTGRLYAVQLVYRDNSAESTDADVYAARNVYVWPSTSSPSGDYAITVGGLDLQRRLTRKATPYRICADSFAGSSDRKRKWNALIDEGFRQWSAATGNLVTFYPLADCATDPLTATTYDTIMKKIKEQVTNNPAVTALRNIDDYVKQLRQTLVINGVPRGSVVSRLREQSDRLYEIYMFDDKPLDTIKRTTIFANISTYIGYWEACWFEGGKWENAANMCHWPRKDAAGKVRASKIIIRRGAYDAGPGSDPGVTADDELLLPDSGARFNSCFNDDSERLRERIHIISTRSRASNWHSPSRISRFR